MAHRYVLLPFKADGFGPTSATVVTVAVPASSARVDLATGAVVSEGGAHEYARRNAPDPSVALGDLVERAEETASGPVTHLSNGALSVRLEGELTEAWRGGSFLVAVLSGTRRECVGLVFGGARVVLPAGACTSVAGEGMIAACATGECVHVFRFEASGVRSVSVAVPPASSLEGPQVFVTGSRVCVVSGDKLLIIDAAELDFAEAPSASSITYEPLVGPGGGDPEPAIVAFVLPESILLDHPRLKRLRVAKTAEVAKGDQVILDDVREALPGIFRVEAWHKVGAGMSPRAPAPALELLAPADLSAVTPARRPTGPKVPDSERLAALASRHGFRVPELLMRVLEMRESDLVFRRWLDKLGLDAFEVRSLTVDWDADPHVLAFCGLGNGDEYSLYVYPPWCSEGHEPLVVEYLHETNFVEFRALTFEAFFDDELEQRADDDDSPELVRMVRERLDFPRGERDTGAPPAWLPRDGIVEPPPPGGFFGSVKKLFSKAPAPKPPLERALDEERAGNVLDAERTLLRSFLARSEPGAARELRRIYTQLGWTLALENIASVDAAQ